MERDRGKRRGCEKLGQGPGATRNLGIVLRRGGIGMSANYRNRAKMLLVMAAIAIAIATIKSSFTRLSNALIVNFLIKHSPDKFEALRLPPSSIHRSIYYYYIVEWVLIARNVRKIFATFSRNGGHDDMTMVHH